MTPTDESGHSTPATRASVFTFADLVTAAERLGTLAERARRAGKLQMADHLDGQAQDYRSMAVDVANLDRSDSKS